MKPSGHVQNHAGDLSRATGHLRAAVAKRRGRPPAAPFWIQIELARSLTRIRPGSGLDPAQFECFLRPGSGLVLCGRILAGSDLDPTWIQIEFTRFLARIRPESSAIEVLFGTLIRPFCVWTYNSWIRSGSGLDPDRISTILDLDPALWCVAV